MFEGNVEIKCDFFIAEGNFIAEDDFIARGNFRAEGYFIAKGNFIAEGNFRAEGNFIAEGYFIAEGNFRAKGNFIAHYKIYTESPIHIGDVDGYAKYLVMQGGKPYIESGCRYFSLDDAIEHWGNHKENRDLTMCLMETAKTIVKLKMRVKNE